jgi:hypothetical protein
MFKGATSCHPLSHGVCGFGEQCILARGGLASSTGQVFGAGLKLAAHIPQPNRGRGRFGQA